VTIAVAKLTEEINDQAAVAEAAGIDRSGEVVGLSIRVLQTPDSEMRNVPGIGQRVSEHENRGFRTYRRPGLSSRSRSNNHEAKKAQHPRPVHPLPNPQQSLPVVHHDRIQLKLAQLFNQLCQSHRSAINSIHFYRS